MMPNKHAVHFIYLFNFLTQFILKAIKKEKTENNKNILCNRNAIKRLAYTKTLLIGVYSKTSNKTEL